MNDKHLESEYGAKYFNRDLSWIEFNLRVLEEAQDASTPLLEKIKFLSIVSTNLDEFMSVRVAGIIDRIKAGYTKEDFAGYTSSALLKRIMRRTQKMVKQQYKVYREIMRNLTKEGISFTTYDVLTISQKKALEHYFKYNVFPVLTPMAVDQSRPFPLVQNYGLYLAVVLRREGEETDDEPYFAIVQVPSILPRYIEVPSRANSKKKEFILLENLITEHIQLLFSHYIPVAVHAFRITRNADMTLNEEGAEDLLEEIEKELKKRRWGSPVRLEVEEEIHGYALTFLQDEFEINDQLFYIDGPLDLSFLMKFSHSLEGYEHLRYPRIEPIYPKEFDEDDDFFAVLRQKDVLVYHPYESFEAVNDFIIQAAEDPAVLAIKMTLYRVSGNSLIVQALALAAESGKQVTVVVELKARFDEERNIAWARQLEQSGCHVVYGLVGLKTHAKITLVVRQEEGSVRRYVHVGTGNYNDNTARLYTDIGLFTSEARIGEDASALFNEMTGYSAPRNWKVLEIAPVGMKQKFIELIRREATHAKDGKQARIIAKMNSLSNQEMVDECYAASQAGVHIDLIVRGVCCLRPGVPGLSDNITVRSIVDRFLEHTRIYYFENGGQPEIWIASADWMTRNLTRRIELMCPVLHPELHQTLLNILQLSLSDNVKARELSAGGTYHKVNQNEHAVRSQFEASKTSNWRY